MAFLLRQTWADKVVTQSNPLIFYLHTHYLFSLGLLQDAPESIVNFLVWKQWNCVSFTKAPPPCPHWIDEEPKYRCRMTKQESMANIRQWVPLCSDNGWPSCLVNVDSQWNLLPMALPSLWKWHMLSRAGGYRQRLAASQVLEPSAHRVIPLPGYQLCHIFTVNVKATMFGMCANAQHC